jgi:predicted RNase H-like HicB family nuclease
MKIKSTLSAYLSLAHTHTHGNTYADTLNNGEEVLELLIEDYQAQRKPLPEPLTANVSFQFVQSSP